MTRHPLPLAGAFILETQPHEDDRGMFSRLFCHNDLQDLLDGKQILQINHSLTRHKGALRGMHFQRPPQAEIKIVTCLAGSVFDVIIDIRQNSPTFLQWHGVRLSPDNRKLIFIPDGFAHGFQTLEENSELLYLHTAFYSPDHEGAIHYNDPLVDVKWPLNITNISEKDEACPYLNKNHLNILL
jgi:dTDP-4-dehydrorhamnose 3,5-epimerase